MTLTEEYTLLQQLGTGGYATVYKARHNQLGYIRAIRMLNAFVPDQDDPIYQKFLRESRVLLRLGNGSHPNIIHVYQPRLIDNRALIEMDYVEGVDLTHYIKEQRGFVPMDEVFRMAEEISSALAYCHHDIYHYCMDRKEDALEVDPDDGMKVLIDAETERHLVDKYKVIHNDIHSGNIMRRIDGHYILLDFGLAIEGSDVIHSSRHENGAPEYKAPEKWDSDTILNERTDIYSFGVVLYELLAGRVPFQYNKSLSDTKANYIISEAHKTIPPLPIRPLREKAFHDKFPDKVYNEVYPQGLDDIIMRCLEKDPANRYYNGAELYEAVKAFLKDFSQREFYDAYSKQNKTSEKFNNFDQAEPGARRENHEQAEDAWKHIHENAENSHSRDTNAIHDSFMSLKNHALREFFKNKSRWWILLIVPLILLVLVFVLPHHHRADQIIDVGDVSFKMVYVQGGSFTMGCSPSAEYCAPKEYPSHRVKLSGYYMAETEVTQGLWNAVMGCDTDKWSISSRGMGDEYPAYKISYNDAICFIQRLNARTGYNFRLPTEAEWEYAAKGGRYSHGYRYSGSDDLSDVSVTEKQTKYLSPVRCASPNELGIYDMSGNVYEWCSDWYGSYSSGKETNPKGPQYGKKKVLRGGSCYSKWTIRHVTCRDAGNLYDQRVYYGFRLVLDKNGVKPKSVVGDI